MKVTSIFTFLLIIASISLCAKDKEPVYFEGYYIDEMGKHYGYLSTINEYSFQYKKDSTSKAKRIFKTITVSEYKAGDRSYKRVSNLINRHGVIGRELQDEFFAEYILKGDINLYLIRAKTEIIKKNKYGSAFVPGSEYNTVAVGGDGTAAIQAGIVAAYIGADLLFSESTHFIIEKMEGKFVQLSKNTFDYKKMLERFIKDDKEVLKKLNGKKEKPRFVVELIAEYNGQEVPEKYQKSKTKEKKKKDKKKKKR